jgi:hypothetical protein
MISGWPTKRHTRPGTYSPLRRLANSMSNGKMPPSTGAAIVPVKAMGAISDTRIVSRRRFCILRSISLATVQNNPYLDLSRLGIDLHPKE